MNNQENKNKQQTQETSKEGRGKAPQTNGFKSFFAKRWTFPVIYLAASVLIVGLMYAKSKDASFEIKKPATPPNTNVAVGPTLPNSDQPATTASTAPSFMWPVAQDGADATISMGFYSNTANDDAKAQAVVSYDNKFFPHEGVDIGLKSDKPFTVVAAAKGTVTDVSEDPLMGYTVTIDNGDGYTTYYASLADVEVQKGAMVIQGQPIAKSSNDNFEKNEMNHLHFEVRKNGVQIDPNTILTKMPIGDATQSSTKSTTPAAPTSNSTGGTQATGSDAKSNAANSSAPTSPTSGSPVDKAVNGSSTDNSSADAADPAMTENSSSVSGSSDSSSSSTDASTSTQGQAADTSTDSSN